MRYATKALCQLAFLLVIGAGYSARAAYIRYKTGAWPEWFLDGALTQSKKKSPAEAGPSSAGEAGRG